VKQLLAPRKSEVEFTAIRAQGPGGQHVNKVSSAIHLRFDVGASSLPEALKTRWLQAPENRLTAQGVLIIKAQRYRTQEANRQDAWARLLELLERYARPTKTRQDHTTHARLGTKTPREQGLTREAQGRQAVDGMSYSA